MLFANVHIGPCRTVCPNGSLNILIVLDIMGETDSKNGRFGDFFGGLPKYLENIGKYHFFRQQWLDLGVMLMEMNRNLFSRWLIKDRIMIDFKLPEFPERIMKKN